MKSSGENQFSVAVIIGSKSDEEIMQSCLRYLDHFGISSEVKVLSAHRNPEGLRQYVSRLENHGTQLIIAAAGMAAHLPGVIASQTTLPVIGVPLSASELNGLDALLSMVQMPTGIPVATVAIGKAGACNAAVLAAEILAVNSPEIQNKLSAFRAEGSKL
ncbi:MAG: 5-(carboxyamino)imidazole ribonucleotide mutase [bacterium]